MPMVPAVTELLIAEVLYLQYTDTEKPIYLYINSTGCSRADGEVVAYETEAYAVHDALMYVNNPIYTLNVGVAVGNACMLLAAGQKGKRFVMPHSTCMLHQPRIPSTGQRQAVEVDIRWKEVLSEKKTYLKLLHAHTGHSKEKLDKDLSRTLYMGPKDAIAYRVADQILPETEKSIGSVKSKGEWDKAAGLVERPASSM